MNQKKNNQLDYKKQHPNGLPITLDLSVPEPVKLIPEFNLGLPGQLNAMFKECFPALYQAEKKEVTHVSK